MSLMAMACLLMCPSQKGIFDFTSALWGAVCLIPSGRGVYEIKQTRICLLFLFGWLHGGFRYWHHSVMFSYGISGGCKICMFGIYIDCN